MDSLITDLNSINDMDINIDIKSNIEELKSDIESIQNIDLANIQDIDVSIDTDKIMSNVEDINTELELLDKMEQILRGLR